MSPNARSKNLLLEEGYDAQIVEHYNAFSRKRYDFAGFADLLAFRPGETGVLAVQATTRPNQAARLTKLLGLPVVARWLAAGNRAEVHGWSLSGARGKRKRWTVTRTPLVLPLGEVA